jgi:hypothetical protein
MAETSASGAPIRVTRLSIARPSALRLPGMAPSEWRVVVRYRQGDKTRVARLPLAGDVEATQIDALVESVTAGNRQAASDLYARLHERWAHASVSRGGAQALSQEGVWEALLRYVLQHATAPESVPAVSPAVRQPSSPAAA